MIHTKHRERLRKKFLCSPEILEKHEILELLLTFCIPRKNTNNTAHNLLNKFGTFSSIFESDLFDLKLIDGIGENSALFINLINTIFRIIIEEKNKISLNCKNKYLSIHEIENIMFAKFIGKREENVVIALFNKKREIVFCDFLEKGALNFVNMDFRKVVTLVLKYNAGTVVLAHNHPSGIALPSKEDVKVTAELKTLLESLNVNLLEHFIFCGDECVSLVKSGAIECKKIKNVDTLRKAG